MKILFVSLGCDKNLVDTEMMLGELLKKGYEFTDDETDASCGGIWKGCSCWSHMLSGGKDTRMAGRRMGPFR